MDSMDEMDEMDGFAVPLTSGLKCLSVNKLKPVSGRRTRHLNI